MTRFERATPASRKQCDEYCERAVNVIHTGTYTNYNVTILELKEIGKMANLGQKWVRPKNVLRPRKSKS